MSLNLWLNMMHRFEYGYTPSYLMTSINDLVPFLFPIFIKKYKYSKVLGVVPTDLN